MANGDVPIAVGEPGVRNRLALEADHSFGGRDGALLCGQGKNTAPLCWWMRAQFGAPFGQHLARLVRGAQHSKQPLSFGELPSPIERERFEVTWLRAVTED